jgi:hypothetical protein
VASATASASASVNPDNVRVALAGTQTGQATAKALQKAARGFREAEAGEPTRGERDFTP